MELFAEQGNLNVEMDELYLAAESPLIGMSIRESEAHHRFGLLVLAVKRSGGVMTVNPPADFRWECGDIGIVLGVAPEIARFRAEYRMQP
jgi:voltage-gated potassium channel